MSDDANNGTPRSMEDQFRDMLKKANISFMTPATVPEQAERPAGAEPPDGGVDRLKPVREFDLKPRDVRAYFDRFVIGQEEAKKVLSVAICDHYNHVRRCIENPAFNETEYAKHNIILLGPSGVGKTYLMRCAAKLIGVPMVKADATKFSETGYVGHDVEDLVRDLVKTADGDVDLAQYGIIYLDEIDKIAAQGTAAGKDVSGRGVQINLLKLMEETDVSLFSQTDLIGQVQAVMEMQRGKGPGRRTVNTRHMLFIVSGAFDGLAEAVERRLKSSHIGFSDVDAGRREAADYLRLAATRDFIDYGYEPEFIGRLPIRVVCDALSADDLQQIMLNSEGSILGQYRDDFDGYGIEFKVTDDAVKTIAGEAHREKTGARGLMTVLERLFRDFKFELPSTPIRAFGVTPAVVKNPAGALEDMLGNRDRLVRDDVAAGVRKFAREFERQQALKLRFKADAVDAIVELCAAEGKSAEQVCAARFHDFEHGLKLISRNTGRRSFTVTRKLVEKPGEELSRRIARSFGRK